MKTLRFISAGLFAVLLSFTFVACEKDEEVNTPPKETSKDNVSRPEFKKDFTVSTTSDIKFKCRFSNGEDNFDNMNCTVHWRKYSSKPSRTPVESDMTKHEVMKSEWFSRTSTLFDKSHTGLNSGSYIYYYFECSNSKYSAKSKITYTIIKR